jgi:hypothetical protein
MTTNPYIKQTGGQPRIAKPAITREEARPTLESVSAILGSSTVPRFSLNAKRHNVHDAHVVVSNTILENKIPELITKPIDVKDQHEDLNLTPTRTQFDSIGAPIVDGKIKIKAKKSRHDEKQRHIYEDISEHLRDYVELPAAKWPTVKVGSIVCYVQKSPLRFHKGCIVKLCGEFCGEHYFDCDSYSGKMMTIKKRQTIPFSALDRLFILDQTKKDLCNDSVEIMAARANWEKRHINTQLDALIRIKKLEEEVLQQKNTIRELSRKK